MFLNVRKVEKRFEIQICLIYCYYIIYKIRTIIIVERNEKNHRFAIANVISLVLGCSLMATKSDIDNVSCIQTGDY